MDGINERLDLLLANPLMCRRCMDVTKDTKKFLHDSGMFFVYMCRDCARSLRDNAVGQSQEAKQLADEPSLLTL